MSLRNARGRSKRGSTGGADDDSSVLSVHSIAQIFGGQLPFIEYRSKIKQQSDQERSQYLLDLMTKRQEELRREVKIKKYRSHLVSAASDVASIDEDDLVNQKCESYDDYNDKVVHEERGFRDRVDFFEGSSAIHHSCSKGSEPSPSPRNQSHNDKHISKEAIDQDLGLNFVAPMKKKNPKEESPIDHRKRRSHRLQQSNEKIRENKERPDSVVSRRIHNLETNSRTSQSHSKQSNMAESSTVVASYNRSHRDHNVQKPRTSNDQAQPQLNERIKDRMMRKKEIALEYSDFSPQQRALHGLPIVELQSYQNYAKTVEDRAIESIKNPSKSNVKTTNFDNQKSKSTAPKVPEALNKVSAHSKVSPSEKKRVSKTQKLTDKTEKSMRSKKPHNFTQSRIRTTILENSPDLVKPQESRERSNDTREDKKPRGPAMERLLKAREEASQKEKEKGKETEYNLVDTDFLGPEDIPLSSYETLSDRDDVSCITNPTFAGGMYLREFSEDTASKTNLSEQFEPNFQALSSNSTRSSGENDIDDLKGGFQSKDNNSYLLDNTSLSDDDEVQIIETVAREFGFPSPYTNIPQSSRGRVISTRHEPTNRASTQNVDKLPSKSVHTIGKAQRNKAEPIRNEDDNWGFQPFSSSPDPFDSYDPFDLSTFEGFDGGANAFKTFSNTNVGNDSEVTPKLVSKVDNLQMSDPEPKSVRFSEITKTKEIESTGILKPPKYNLSNASNSIEYLSDPITRSDPESKGRGRPSVLQTAIGAIRRARSRSKERRVGRSKERSKRENSTKSNFGSHDEDASNDFIYLKLKPKMAHKISLLVQALDSSSDNEDE